MADTIRRTKRAGNFTTVRNEYLQDVNLSWKAKGLITYVMSLPPDWQLNLPDLKKRSKDGRDATAAGLRELITNGYCQRYKIRSGGGTFVGCDYEVSDIKEFEPEQPQTDFPFMDTPQTGNPDTVNPYTGNPDTVNPYTGNPDTVNPDTENPTLINTNITNDSNKPNTNHSKPANPVVGDLFPEQQDLEKDKKRTSIFRNSDVYKLVKFGADGVNDYSEFEKLFATPEFEKVDLIYYFHTVADWSETKQGVKRTRTGWIATVRNFIRGDIEKKKLHLKPEYQAPQKQLNVADAMEFLNNDY